MASCVSTKYNGLVEGSRSFMVQAMYRRYRPQTFDEVIGQEQVTEPLKAALRSGRINHAYLFSGPRGCGKTTSARILARCLNCEQGPTDTPCGTCPSCVDLALDGGGSLDVVEIDAASHNGVEDARSLRERAFFAPVRDRFKIFILDEAHMVTTQGFNALLKLVEEPPEHVKFIFATTEPEKVLSTIRSRTHHYPFRLVAPELVTKFMAHLCDLEHISYDNAVLSLITRAGAGSVRDSLSILDQVIAGCENDTLDYDRVRKLLGYTDASKLEAIVDAFAGRDGASVFEQVEQIIDSGQDPRRFIEDFLEKVRDLLLISVAGVEAKALLSTYSDQQIEKMQNQASVWGRENISTAADCCVQSLNEMVGATSARIHLELLCARILVPSITNGAASYVDMNAETAVATASVQSTAQTASPKPSATNSTVNSAVKDLPAMQALLAGDSSLSTSSLPSDEQFDTLAKTKKPGEVLAPAPFGKPITMPDKLQIPPVADKVSDSRVQAPPVQPASALEPQPSAPAPATEQEQTQPSVPEQGSEKAPAETPRPAVEDLSQVHSDLIRLRWEEVCKTLNIKKKSTWALVSHNSTPGAFDGNTLTLYFSNKPLADMFSNGNHSQALVAALYEVLGIRVNVNAVVGEASATSPADKEYPQSLRTSPSSNTTNSPAARNVFASTKASSGAPTGVRNGSVPNETVGKPALSQSVAQGEKVNVSRETFQNSDTQGQQVSAPATKSVQSEQVAQELVDPWANEPDFVRNYSASAAEEQVGETEQHSSETFSESVVQDNLPEAQLNTAVAVHSEKLNAEETTPVAGVVTPDQSTQHTSSSLADDDFDYEVDDDADFFTDEQLVDVYTENEEDQSAVSEEQVNTTEGELLSSQMATTSFSQDEKINVSRETSATTTADQAESQMETLSETLGNTAKPAVDFSSFKSNMSLAESVASQLQSQKENYSSKQNYAGTTNQLENKNSGVTIEQPATVDKLADTTNLDDEVDIEQDMDVESTTQFGVEIIKKIFEGTVEETH